MNLILRNALIAAGLVTVNFSVYANPGYVALPDKPLYVGGGVQPMVMLDITKDHQLHMKAYNDYSDLDSDGKIELTYKHSINYYGYFDSHQCYSYNVSNNRFDASAVTADKYCNGSSWSGNFLNWATMTRMDTVRKILYGGTRVIDTKNLTVLERNMLPPDAHSFAKYYNGPDIKKLTPFSNSLMSTNNFTTDSVKMPTVIAGTYQSKAMIVHGNLMNDYPVGSQVLFKIKAPATASFEGTITELSYSGGKTKITMRVYNEGIKGIDNINRNSWDLTNHSQSDGGISLCNLTQGESSGVNSTSQTNTNPPLLRVARGNFELWASNSAMQCQWTSEQTGSAAGFGSVASNGNIFSVTSIKSSAENPDRNVNGLGFGIDIGEYIVRLKVCDPTYIQDGTDEKTQGKCKQYGSSWKPIGLLQKYSDTDLIRFGLMTGSYRKNISGGVLRKNIDTMADEIDISTGIFKDKNYTSTNPPSGSIIKTIDRMRIYGYNFSAKSYLSDGCGYQLTSIKENNCRSYGNPMSEIYYESIRYLAGNSETPDYNYNMNEASAADNILGLSKATWSDPLNADNFCAPLNVLVFNSSVAGEDKDLESSSVNQFTFPPINNSIKQMTDSVGQLELLDGKVANFGAYSGLSQNANDYVLCSPKNITSLGDIFGICPEGPSNNGSYHMAGIASVVKNNRIRNFTSVPNNDTNALKVNSYAIQLASNTPEIEIPVNGKIVKLSPIYRLDKSSTGVGPFGSGAIVDFKISKINASGSEGSLYINWEDSQQGGDYDSDLWGILSWEVTAAGKLKITTKTVAASGANGQGFGYSVSGTSKDGPHFHSGIYNYDFEDDTNIEVYNSITNLKLNNNASSRINNSGGCRNCIFTDPATYVLYDVTGLPTTELKDPLYYLAKYGGFKDKNNSKTPDLIKEWDALINSTGESGSDGVPDNYFYAVNPLQLEKSLKNAFNSILVTSSSSSVSSNSTFLKNNTLVYQAKYFTGDWSGQFFAYNLNSLGAITSVAWEGDLLMNSISSNDREIITWNRTSKRGVPYRFTTPSANGLSSSIISALNKNSAGTVDNNGAKRLDWARGSSAEETGLFRVRARTKLGDIIDSSPVYVGIPESSYNDPTFNIFKKNQASRDQMIYVGSNDGMLHGFDAINGTLKFSYMPGTIAEGALISKTSSPAYGDNIGHSYGVNGSPTVADIKFGQNCSLLNSLCDTDIGWKTILVGGLNHGGKGIYALDITNPAALKESNAINVALWEFNNISHPGVGYTFSQPKISRICNTRTGVFKPQLCTDSTPVAIFGGGYNSDSGKGTLFVVNLQTGALISSVDVAGGSVVAPNALASVSILDVDGDGTLEYVYAGDLNGKMWKFDLQDSTNIKLDFSGSPLYHSKDGAINQPITSSPEIYSHPQGGYLIMYGTGKYIEGSDLGNRDLQTFYSIWDKNLPVNVLSGKNNLQEQITTNTLYTPADAFNAVGAEYRKSSTNVVDWSSKDGWYMNMGDITSADPGERIIYSPKIYNNGIVSFSSLVPAGGVCAFGGYSWNYFLDSVTGSSLKNSIFGTKEANLSSNKSRNGIVTPATLIHLGNGIAYAPQSGTSGNLEINKYDLSGGRTGRVSWREIK